MPSQIDAVLLAAGESTRMGQPKAVLPWAGRPLLVYQIEQLLASPVGRVAVVLGHRAADLRPLLPVDPRLTVVENRQYRSGKVSSIVAGLRALASQLGGDRANQTGRHVLILGVDQPRPAQLITQVAAAHLASQLGGGAPVTVAGYGGRRGHPVLFAPALRDELFGIDEATQGLRAVLQRHRAEVRVCETGSPLALANLNTPEDYEAALRLVNTGQPSQAFANVTWSARAGNQ